MRSTRYQWLARLFPFRFKAESMLKPPVPKKQPKKPPLFSWVVRVGPQHTLTVQAATKSEARAAIKRAMKIKGRLPVGTKVRRDS